MNKERRKQLQECAADLQSTITILEELHDEESEYKDNMPEAFQDGERGEKAEEFMTAIQEAIDSAQTGIDSIDEAIN